MSRYPAPGDAVPGAPPPLLVPAAAGGPAAAETVRAVELPEEGHAAAGRAVPALFALAAAMTALVVLLSARRRGTASSRRGRLV